MQAQQAYETPEFPAPPPTIQRIPTEGKRITPVRNAPRIVLEVETETPGMTPEGHYLKVTLEEDGTRVRTTSRIEIYLDRLGPLMRDHYRLPKHEAVWAQACEISQRRVDGWAAERKNAMRGMSGEQRAAYIHQHCNLGPAMELKNLGFPTGIPNLLSVKLVSQDDESKTCDVADFVAKTDKGEYLMEDTERAEFVGSAPRTDDNALDKSGEMIAKVLERALSGVGKKR